MEGLAVSRSTPIARHRGPVHPQSFACSSSTPANARAARGPSHPRITSPCSRRCRCSARGWAAAAAPRAGCAAAAAAGGGQRRRSAAPSDRRRSRRAAGCWQCAPRPTRRAPRCARCCCAPNRGARARSPQPPPSTLTQTRRSQPGEEGEGGLLPEEDVQVPGTFRDAMSAHTELGRAVRGACDELEQLQKLVGAGWGWGGGRAWSKAC